MPRPRGIPKYRRHSSGQARVRLVDAISTRQKDILLGKYGTKESRAEYGRIIAQWEAAVKTFDAYEEDVTKYAKELEKIVVEIMTVLDGVCAAEDHVAGGFTTQDMYRHGETGAVRLFHRCLPREIIDLKC